MPLEIYSPDFDDDDTLPEEFTCDGDNSNPTLIIVDPPEDTETFTLIVEDLDSVKGDFTHWLVWNIPATTTHIITDELPDTAVEGYNDFGSIGYGGPCPKQGEHRYQFRLYAMDTEFDLDEDTTKAKLEKEMAGHIIDEATITGLYSRD